MRSMQNEGLWLIRQAENIFRRDARAAAFYFEREYGSEDAERAVEDASFILTEVKRLLAIGSSNKDK